MVLDNLSEPTPSLERRDGMKKKEIRIHTTLSNGQHAAIYFRLDRNVRFDDGYQYDCWYVGFMVGNKARQCNDWWNDRKNNNRLVQTGRCGMEGLIWAKQQIVQFMASHKGEYIQYMVVGGMDDKRQHVYSRLTKIGFTPGTYDGDQVHMVQF